MDTCGSSTKAGSSVQSCNFLTPGTSGREASYSSLLKQSVSTRRAKLYESKGLDLDLQVEESQDRGFSDYLSLDGPT